MKPLARRAFVMLLLAAPLCATAQSRSASTFDVYGYQAYDSIGNGSRTLAPGMAVCLFDPRYPPQSPGAPCSYNYVDATGGTALVLVPASGTAPANDDGGTVVTLAASFEFYGVSANSLVASSNGYLALPADASSEDGGDFSQDCPLPAIADNPMATQARIYAYHADLDGGPNGGNMYENYYPSCPRASESGSSEACTVVQWQNWARRGKPGTLNMEAVLYHTSFEIVLQYQTLDASAGVGVTVGTQSNNATSGNAYRCGITDRLFANGFEP